MSIFKLIREFSKRYGRSPSPSELDKLKDDEKLSVKVNKIMIENKPHLKIDIIRVKK